MGILDSNLKTIKGLEKTATLWTAHTGAVSPGTIIDCADYNTMQIQVFSATDPTVLNIIGWYEDGVSTLNHRIIPVVDVTEFAPIKVWGDSLKIPVTSTYERKVFLVDVTHYKSISIAKSATGSVTLSYKLDQTFKAYEYINNNENVLRSKIFTKIFSHEKFDLYGNNNYESSSGRYFLQAAYENIVVWSNGLFANPQKLFISTTGLDGLIEEIELNSTNFPNLITGSSIEKVIIMPFTRNNTYGYTSANEWRMNVITNKGQIYHNYPARSASSDGTAQTNDYKVFDESVIWDLPNRLHPVKTTSGSDAALIATGKYKYYPALPAASYTLYPGINVDNGYGNTGFPATITKTKTTGGSVTLSRFWQPIRNSHEYMSFAFMGSYAPGEKLTLLGTYVSNTTIGTRICVFATEDGGRQWYNIYEFGASGQVLSSDGNTQLASPVTNYGSDLAFTATACGENIFNIKKRSTLTPDSSNKEIEKTAKFKYSNSIAVKSITGGASITVETTTAHGLVNGDIIVFELVGTNADWDWLKSTGHTTTSAGDGVLFKVKNVTSTTFTLTAEVHNPENNLVVRHIHSINQCKDGFVIGTGETYPQGWILWMKMIQSDIYAVIRPWDTHEFIRLNSTSTSVQRPLGMILKTDGTVYVGIDNETTQIGNAVMPSGRTDTFARGSQGVYKGKLEDFDDQSKFTNILESKEVAFFFKEILGVMIYAGQRGHLAISFDSGVTWVECKIPKNIYLLAPITGTMAHYVGTTQNREIIISNVIIKLK